MPSVMARAGTAVFLTAMSTLFMESMPFVVVQPKPTTCNLLTDSRKVLVRTATACAEQRLCAGRAGSEGRVGPLFADSGTPIDGMNDVCKGGDEQTQLWYRVAHKNMPQICVGDQLPDVTVRRLEDDGSVRSLTLTDLFGDKKGVLVGVPGAFTPTCSQVHLPEFVSKSSELAAKGADVVAFMSVNDVYVMRAWEENQSAQGKVVMLSDGNGELSATLGMMVDLSEDGMGLRCRRFMLVAEKGQTTYIAVGDGPGMGGVSASAAERALDATRRSTAKDMALHAELERELEARAASAAVAAEAAGKKEEVPFAAEWNAVSFLE